jgi:CheY-like chemotaxis protein
VTVAGSTAEALRRLAHELPHVVLTDLGMPGDDGFALLNAVRAIAPTRIPVAALTAYASEIDRGRVEQAGFDGYVAKPADPLDIVRMVARLRGPGADRPKA